MEDGESGEGVVMDQNGGGVGDRRAKQRRAPSHISANISIHIFACI